MKAADDIALLPSPLIFTRGMITENLASIQAMMYHVARIHDGLTPAHLLKSSWKLREAVCSSSCGNDVVEIVFRATDTVHRDHVLGICN